MHKSCNSNLTQTSITPLLHPAALHSHKAAFLLTHCDVDATATTYRRPRQQTQQAGTGHAGAAAAVDSSRAPAKP